MSIEIVVPQVGEAISAARLVQWYKKEGDFVKKGEPLFAVDTDKAVLDVEAFSEGVLEKILIAADNEVQPEMVVGLLSGVGATPATAEAPATKGPVTPPSRMEPPRASAVDAPPADSAPISISPKARQLARELGVDVKRLARTHGDRMITENDVTAAAGGSGAAGAVVPLTKMRETIALRTQRSKQTVPHFYLMAEVNMTRALSLRGKVEPKCSLTVIIAQACAQALRTMPDANISFTERGLHRRTAFDIGIAVSVDGGLLVPVIRDAATRSLPDMDSWLKETRQRIGQGKSRQADFGERSLTISNLGMHAVDRFIAIIDTPDPVMLAVGAVQDRAVVESGAVVVRPMCTLTLSVDHRVLDGVDGAKLLNLIRQNLEHAG
jgi:pyruvate dehydrogenase E2 component (dihydrolipoamide acetyltransferase)